MSVGLVPTVPTYQPTNTTRYKVFWGVETVYRGIQPSNLPLKYSPGCRPLGMADPGNGRLIPLLP